MSIVVSSNNEKMNNIINDYKEDVSILFCKEETPGCYYEKKIILIKYEIFKNPSEEDLFDFLHEIGHIETNKRGMKRCEEEYYATEWALKHKDLYNVKLTQKRKNEYQNYIWRWRDGAIARKGKNVPSKEKLTLSI